MSGALTLGAALLLGTAASGHCLVMCGGITAALGIATAKRADGRPRTLLLLGYQAGRIFSYTLAGLLFGGVLGGLIGLLDIDAVRQGLRLLSALALLLGAFVAFGRVRDTGLRLTHGLWSRLAPVGRRLLPVRSLPGAFAFGMIWGWMPCGFVYTVLLIAALQLDAANAAATMAAFGLGTVPAMFATTFGAQRFVAIAARTGGKRVAGALLLASAMLTLMGPWLVIRMPWLHAWLPFECAIPH